MPLDEICALPIPATPDAVLFMWTTNPLLPEALRVFEAWGFGYKSNMVWAKDKIGLGYIVRNQQFSSARRSDGIKTITMCCAMAFQGRRTPLCACLMITAWAAQHDWATPIPPTETSYRPQHLILY
jgi:hypothetical protein